MPQQNFLKRILNFWLGPVDCITIDSFRVVSGLAILFYSLFRFACAREWLTAEGFHISPSNLPYHDIVVPLLPEGWLPVFGVLLFGSLLAMIVGWRLPWSSWLAWGCFLYATWADQLAAFVANKLAVVSLLIIALASPGRYWSVEKKKEAPNVCSAWSLRILQSTLIAHYFLAGLNKIVFGEWWRDPYVLWSQIQGTYLTDFGAWMVRFFPLWIWPALQLSALAFELLAPVLFGIQRFRKMGLWWGLIFQTLINATMHQLVFFSFVVLSFYAAFLETEYLKEWERRIFKRKPGFL